MYAPRKYISPLRGWGGSGLGMAINMAFLRSSGVFSPAPARAIRVLPSA
jgi:hypothetical protein